MDDVVRSKLAIIEEAAGWNFVQDWFSLSKEGLARANSGGDLDHPGIYDIGLATPIPQIHGDTRIIYVGRAAGQQPADRGTLLKSLDRHIGNGCGVEKWLRASRPEPQLFARTAIADSNNQAKFWEKLRFRWFIEQFWSLPIGNIQSVASHPMDEEELRELIVCLRRRWLKQ